MNVKNAFKKENFMPVVVLVSICIVVAALLGVVNMLTSPIIEEAGAAAVKESLSIVMPDGEFNSEPDELKADKPETVQQVFTEKTGKGTVVVLLTNKGYTGNDIGITVAIDAQGKLIKAVVTKNDESIVPASMAPGGDYGDKFIGKDASSVTSVDTGVTVKYSDAAAKNAIYDAFVYLGFAEPAVEFDNEGVTDTKSETVIATLLEMTGKSFTAIDKAEGLKNNVKGVYTADDSLALHIATRTEYTPLESEGIVVVDGGGYVTHVKMLAWNVWGWNTPDYVNTECTPEYLNSFIGLNKSSLDRVEHITHVTNTSGNFKNAVKDALNVLYPVNTFTIIGISVLALAVVLSVCAAVYLRKRRTDR